MVITDRTGRTISRVDQQDGALTADALSDLRDEFLSRRDWRNAQNAVTRITADDIALNRAVLNTIDHTFSNVLDDWAVTNQKNSGRCWIFAGLNLLRVGAMQTMQINEFEFSQVYTHFWDKLERSNYLLEAIIETIDRDQDDRTVAFLLERPLEDGGQWNMFVNLVKKHGLVPLSSMPETESSSNTRRMNSILYAKLRESARILREARQDGASIADLQVLKEQQMRVIYRILCIHLGTPPATVQWQWKDKDGTFHRDEEMTPQEFAAKYITVPLDEYVCLVHDPRATSPIGRTYTVEYLGNVVGGDIVTYLNIEAELLKGIAMRTIVSGEPVWFGCDVGKMMQHKLGLWDRRLFEFDALYDTEFCLDKAGRLDYHDTLMTHAMLFTGVDVLEGRPRRWRVENSWGDELGHKGFFVMNDNWFADYTFEIAARKSYLPAHLQEALNQEPIVLPAWDPMGALAR